MAPVRAAGLLGLLLLGQRALGTTPAPTPTDKFLVARASEKAPDVTEVTDCHPHENGLCVPPVPLRPFDARRPLTPRQVLHGRRG